MMSYKLKSIFIVFCSFLQNLKLLAVLAVDGLVIHLR